nr:RNA-directed DNA polymerase, eukaryota [Tanacetum cinerariifolium]
MIKLQSSKAKLNLMKHKGVESWFSHLCNAQQDFVANEQIIWVDIEGVPHHAWSHNTFLNIGSIWGEVMEVDDDDESIKGDAENVMEVESDSEAVSDSFFGDNEYEKECAKDVVQSSIAKEGSADPFNIYELLNKRDKDAGNLSNEGGSILEVLDEMIKVGQAMGFAMDGCTRDMENTIGSQGEHEVPR